MVPSKLNELTFLVSWQRALQEFSIPIAIFVMRLIYLNLKIISHKKMYAMC